MTVTSFAQGPAQVPVRGAAAAGGQAGAAGEGHTQRDGSPGAAQQRAAGSVDATCLTCIVTACPKCLLRTAEASACVLESPLLASPPNCASHKAF